MNNSTATLQETLQENNYNFDNAFKAYKINLLAGVEVELKAYKPLQKFPEEKIVAFARWLCIQKKWVIELTHEYLKKNSPCGAGVSAAMQGLIALDRVNGYVFSPELAATIPNNIDLGCKNIQEYLSKGQREGKFTEDSLAKLVAEKPNYVAALKFVTSMYPGHTVNVNQSQLTTYIQKYGIDPNIKVVGTKNRKYKGLMDFRNHGKDLLKTQAGEQLDLVESAETIETAKKANRQTQMTKFEFLLDTIDKKEFITFTKKIEYNGSTLIINVVNN